MAWASFSNVDVLKILPEDSVQRAIPGGGRVSAFLLVVMRGEEDVQGDSEEVMHLAGVSVSDELLSVQVL